MSKDTLTDRQKQVRKVLESCNGSVAEAARRLGVSPSTIRSSVKDAQQAQDSGLSPAERLSSTSRKSAANRRLDLGKAAPPEGWDPVRITTDENGAVKYTRSIPESVPIESVPPGHIVKGVSTFFDGSGEPCGQWVKTRLEDTERWNLFYKAVKEQTEQYRGIAAPVICNFKADPDTCSIYPLGDPHIGMLSWSKETTENHDTKIACEIFINAIQALVSRTPASETAYLVNVGDLFHAEDDSQLTPGHGHKLDVDSRKAKVARAGFTLMRSMIDHMLLRHQRVYVINARGNHDPEMALMLAMWLEAVYENEPRVTVLGAENPYIYFSFGNSLVGVHHGDGAKVDQLPQIMAADEPELWGKSIYRYWLTGHIHHLTRKEFPGCVVESFRTMAARDYWHHQKGYRSGRSMESITLHKEYGEFARLTVGIREITED